MDKKVWHWESSRFDHVTITEWATRLEDLADRIEITFRVVAIFETQVFEMCRVTTQVFEMCRVTSACPCLCLSARVGFRLRGLWGFTLILGN